MASLGDLIVTVGARIDGFEQGMKTVSSRLAAIDRQANNMVRGFERMGEAATQVGTGLTAAFTVPVAGLGILTGKLATDFDLAMRKVNSIVDNASQTTFTQLSAEVLKLSKTMGVDAVQAALALYQTISSGISPENAISFLEIASRSAIAGLTDTRTAVNALTTVVLAFGLQASETSQVADAMFEAVKLGKMEFPDLADSIGQAAGTAHKLGISYQELLAATATLTLTTGSTASDAITKLSSAMKAMLHPTDQMSELMKIAGFNMGSTMVRTLGLEGALNALNLAARGSTDVLEAAFGRIEGLRGIFGLVGTNAALAADHLQKLQHASEGLGQTTITLNEINRSFSRQLDILIANLKASGIVIGNALIPAYTQLLAIIGPTVKRLDELANGFASLDVSTRSMIVAIAGGFAVMGPLLLIFGTLTAATASLISGMYALGGAFLAVIAGGVALVKLLAEIVYAIRIGMVGALTAAEAATLRWVGSLALLYAGWTAWQQIKNAVTGVDELTASLQAVGGPTERYNQLMGEVPAKARESAATINVFADAIRSVAGPALSEFSQKLSEVNWSRFWLGAKGPGGALNQLISQLKEVGELVLPLVSKSFENTGDAAAKAVIAMNASALATVKVSDSSILHTAITRGLVMSMNDASRAMQTAGDAAKKGADGFLLQSQVMEKLKAAATHAEDSYKLMLASFYSGNATIDQVTAAWGRMDKAQTAADPTITLNREKQQKAFGVITDLAGAVSDLEHQFDTSIGKTRQFADTQPILAAEVALVTKAYRAHIEAIAEMNVGLTKSGQPVKDLGENLADLSLAMENLQTGIKLTTDKHLPEFAIGLYNVIPQIKALSDAEKLLGIDHVNTSEKMIAASKLYEESGIATPHKILLERRKVLKEIIAEEEAAGQTVTLAQSRQLQKMEDQLNSHRDRVFGTWQNFVAGINGILKGLGSTFARNFFAAFSDDNNKRLDQEESSLRESLQKRGQDYQSFVDETNRKLGEIYQNSAENLAKQEGDLREGLEKQRQAYEEYVASVLQKIEDIREKHAQAIADETSRQMEGLRNQEASFQEYQAAQIESLEEFKRRSAERLAEQLDDLRRSLADRAASYEEYAADAIESIEKVHRKNQEHADDQIGNVKESLKDKEIDYKRFVEDTAEKIARLRKKNGGVLTDEERDLEKSLQRRAEDMELYRRRAQEKIDDIRKKQADDNREQEDAIRRSLEKRKEEWEKYKKGVEDKILDLQKKALEAVDAEEKKVNDSIEARANALIAYRKKVRDHLDELIADHAAAQEKEERDLNDSLIERGGAWQKYQDDAASKLEALRNAARLKLDDQVEDLRIGLNKHRAEWDNYSTDVQAKLTALVAAHDTIVGRIGQAWVDSFKTVGQKIVEFGAEFLVGKLFKWLEEKLLGDILEKLGAKLIDIFSDKYKLPGTQIPPVGGTGPVGGGGGGGGGITSSGGGALSSNPFFEAWKIGWEIGKTIQEGKAWDALLEDMNMLIVELIYFRAEFNDWWGEWRLNQHITWDWLQAIRDELDVTANMINFHIERVWDELANEQRWLLTDSNAYLRDLRDTLTPFNTETGRREVAHIHVTIDGREVGNAMLTSAQLRGALL